MAKASYAATKKALKSDRLFIQVIEKNIYLTEGHFIIYMPLAHYNEFLAGTRTGKNAVLPALVNDDDAFYELKWDGITKKEDGLNIKKFFDDLKSRDYHIANFSPIIFEIDKNRFLRTLIYRDGEIVHGVAVSKIFTDALEDWFDLTKPVYSIDEKSPLYITNDCYGIMILPVNVGHDSDFTEFIKSMNAEHELNKKIKELEKRQYA